MNGIIKIGERTVSVVNYGNGYIAVVYKGYRLAEGIVKNGSTLEHENPILFKRKLLELETSVIQQARKTMKEVVKHEERGLTMKDFVCGK